MFAWYPTVNPLVNLDTWASKMRRNLSRIAPVSAIPPISSTPRHPRNSYDTWCDTNTGHHLKWYQPVSKSPPHETSQDRYSDTDHSHSKNSVSDMLTLLETSRSFVEKHDCKIQKIDRTQLGSTSIMTSTSTSRRVGKTYNEISSLSLEKPTNGLSVKA